MTDRDDQSACVDGTRASSGGLVGRTVSSMDEIAWTAIELMLLPSMN